MSLISKILARFNMKSARRSLLVMSDEARYAYSHGIVPRKYDIVPLGGIGPLTLVQRGTRVSFTFRKTMKGPCHCVYPQFCDSQKDKRINMDDGKAQALELAHVHTVYEEIAVRKLPCIRFSTLLTKGNLSIQRKFPGSLQQHSSFTLAQSPGFY